MRAGPVAGLILALVLPVRVAAAELRHVGTYVWEAEIANGLSGIEVSDDGLSFVMVSDRGWYFEGRFEREGGRIAGLSLDRVLPILGQDGLPVTARRVGDWSDAEGIAVLPDGTQFISFERWAHVWRYDVPGGGAAYIRDHPEFYDYADNRQLEAIAADPQGRIIVLPEQVHGETGAFPVYRLEDEGWQIVGQIERQGRFGIVGGDYGPDGRLYLLERGHFLGLWWRSRIRRFDVADGAGEVLWTSRYGAFHNLEGLAVWPEGEDLRITLVSDNNQRPGEPPQFVEFRLTGGAAAR